MKKTQNHSYHQSAKFADLIRLLSSKELIEKKKRINIYVSQAVVELMDALAVNKSRGELVTELILDKAKQLKAPPYGIFAKGEEITEKEIDEVISQWDKIVDEN